MIRWLRRLVVVLALAAVLVADYLLPKPRALRRVFAWIGRRRRTQP